MTLRTRLVAALMTVAVVLVVVCLVITATTRRQLMDQVDDRLRTLVPREFVRTLGAPPLLDQRVDGTAAAATPAQSPTTVGTSSDGSAAGSDVSVAPGAADVESDVPFGLDPSQRRSDLYQGFITAEGTLLTFFSPNLGDSQLPPPDVKADDVLAGSATHLTVSSVDGSVTYRVLLQPVGDGVSVAGVPIDDVESTIGRLMWIEVGGSAAILVILVLAGWWVVRLGIRPVKRMTRAATRIAAGELSGRLPVTAHGTESGELAIALNQMLARIEAAVGERAESEDRLRRFVSDASHELRTPVTSIRGYAELYRVGALGAPGAVEDAMRRTEQEATRMGRLINDMLTLARFDERRPLASAPVDLDQLVRDAAADARATAPERAISVACEMPVVVVGDDDALRQAIANVVANALVHTDREVCLECRVTDSAGVVEVNDRGDGMAPDVAARVTERFYRADPSRSRPRGGSGLGLAIVDAVVDAHGGRVEILARTGGGTTVRVTLPLVPVSTVEEDPPDSATLVAARSRPHLA